MSELDEPHWEPPKLFVEQVGVHRWSVWVEHRLMRISGEWGTYARTRERAIRKGQRLLAHVQQQEVLRKTREQIQ